MQGYEKFLRYQRLKYLIQDRTPWLFNTAWNIWKHVKPRQVYINQRSAAFLKHHGPVVSSGPLQGLRYPNQLLVTESAVVKLLGKYEAELHPVIEAIKQQPFKTLIDIGAAEGYYAVGLTMHMLDIHTYAFETSRAQQQLCARLATINNVQHRVTIRGACTAESLREFSFQDACVFCDCEGCEFFLLDPDTIPGLHQATIIVELHDFFRPGVSEAIVSRFQETHTIQLIRSESRDIHQYADLTFLSEEDRKLLVAERTVPVQWGYLTPKAR